MVKAHFTLNSLSLNWVREEKRVKKLIAPVNFATRKHSGYALNYKTDAPLIKITIKLIAIVGLTAIWEICYEDVSLERALSAEK